VSSYDDRHIAQARAHGKSEALCGLTLKPDHALVMGPPSMATCWQCILRQCGRPIPPEPEVPEHEKLAKAKKTDDATTLVGEFFDWLTQEKGFTLGKFADDSDKMYPVREPVVKLLAEFFGINENALESEKQALLDHMRAVTKARDWALKEGMATLAAK
jgi:hypothetical protein